MHRHCTIGALAVALLTATVAHLVGQPLATSRLRFEIVFPAAAHAQPVTGRVYVLISRDAQREPRRHRARGGAARVVARLIVDDDRLEPAALEAERRERAADRRGFVARRNEHGYARQVGGSIGVALGVEPLAHAMRLVRRQENAEPRRQRERAAD